LLEVLYDRYGHTSTLVTSQLPTAEWHGWIGGPTLADAVLDWAGAQRVSSDSKS